MADQTLKAKTGVHPLIRDVIRRLAVCYTDIKTVRDTDRYDMDDLTLAMTKISEVTDLLEFSKVWDKPHGKDW